MLIRDALYIKWDTPMCRAHSSVDMTSQNQPGDLSVIAKVLVKFVTVSMTVVLQVDKSMSKDTTRNRC